MVVLGQPKTSAEYIQATSRVGRDPSRPGLVVTLLNVHKPRDRSHYERFETYHATFYRAVEPTSVTPFSPRALDRALVAALVALCRQGDARMTPALGAGEILSLRSALEPVAQRFAERARKSRQPLGPCRCAATARQRVGALPESARRLAEHRRCAPAEQHRSCSTSAGKLVARSGCSTTFSIPTLPACRRCGGDSGRTARCETSSRASISP